MGLGGNGKSLMAEFATMCTPIRFSRCIVATLMAAVPLQGTAADVRGHVLTRRCLNGTATNKTACHTIVQSAFAEYFLVCQACPLSVHGINRAVVAAAGVGGLSFVACCCVVVVIIAHGHDRVSGRAARDRVVLALTIANAVCTCLLAHSANSACRRTRRPRRATFHVP